MTRDDLLWVGIRLAGLYLLLKALVGLPAAVAFLLIAPSLGFESDLTIRYMSQASGVLLTAPAGIYLAFKGERIFRLLSKRGSTTVDTPGVG